MSPDIFYFNKHFAEHPLHSPFCTAVIMSLGQIQWNGIIRQGEINIIETLMYTLNCFMESLFTLYLAGFESVCFIPTNIKIKNKPR